MIEDDITRADLPLLASIAGNFYLGYKLAMNLAGLLLIAGVLMAFYRRLRRRAGHAGDERGRSSSCWLPADADACRDSCCRRSGWRCSTTPWATWSFVSYPLVRAVAGRCRTAG